MIRLVPLRYLETQRMTSGPKLRTLDELLPLRRGWAESRQKVVWTNGVFDLLHAGHVLSLQAARAQGDVLIVGINSDASVRRNKGESRPWMTAGDRAEVLGALACVDYVTIFDESEPSAALDRLRPDFHCKGEDYAGKQIPERAVVEAYGGEIRFLPLLAGRSTTDLIERIRKS